jgi:hypothetical protein
MVPHFEGPWSARKHVAKLIMMHPKTLMLRPNFLKEVVCASKEMGVS